MIGSVIDKIAATVSPAWGAKRVHARQVYDQLTARAYDAATRDRRTANWKSVNQSADLSLLSKADIVRARVRDLITDNAYASGILRTIVRNVVGVGIKPQAMVSDGGVQFDEQFNQAAESLWNRWQKRADVTGRMSFYEIQRLALREFHEAGEILIHFVRSENRSRPLPLALELVEADRLAGDSDFPRNINRQNGNEVRRGIEISPSGEPVAYWLYPKHPNDINARQVQPVRMDAGEFLHLFRSDRAGQTRGISTFAPIVLWLRNLDYYLQNELQSSAVASCFSVAIKTMDGPAGAGLGDTIDTAAVDEDGNTFEYLQPGMVARLLPDEDIEVINPTRQNASSEAWINLMIRSMAVGVGLSFERLSRDYSKTNFSSNRASDLEDRREFRPEQEWLITHLCEPVWTRFIIAAVMERADGFPGEAELLDNFDKWTTAKWSPPGWEWVDPQKEAAASKIALENCLTTLRDELGKRGKDLHETLEQKAREKRMMDELGLSVTPDESAANGLELETQNV